MKKLFSTNSQNWYALIARLALAIVIFPHGAQKMLGWFGGYGFSGTMGFFTGALHLPWMFGLMVILIEFIGSISLIAGFASRFWASLIIVLMIGIITTSHLGNGFFMNWLGNQKGEGFEYHLLVIGLALTSVLIGSGRFSMDRLLVRK